jgi:hypothetical protein
MNEHIKGLNFSSQDFEINLYGESKLEIEENLSVLNKKKFKDKIEYYMINQKLNIIESIEEYCDEHQIDVTEIISLLDSNLKNKIREYAFTKNLVKGGKDSSLPI